MRTLWNISQRKSQYFDASAQTRMFTTTTLSRYSNTRTSGAGVASASGDYWEIPTLQVIDRRYSNSFRYGQMNTPFEYEKLRYFYTEARKLQIGE